MLNIILILILLLILYSNKSDIRLKSKIIAKKKIINAWVENLRF